MWLYSQCHVRSEPRPAQRDKSVQWTDLSGERAEHKRGAIVARYARRSAEFLLPLRLDLWSSVLDRLQSTASTGPSHTGAPPLHRQHERRCAAFL